MGYVVGGVCIVLGIALWGLALFALVSWWIFCFGSVVIGLLLLFFAPHLLIFPLAINIPGTWLITLGLGFIGIESRKKNKRRISLPSDNFHTEMKSTEQLKILISELESIKTKPEGIPSPRKGELEDLHEDIEKLKEPMNRALDK